jgi:ATP-dependent RNA helicase DDX1
LGVTIQQVDSSIKVPHDDFDGKVTYGQKRAATAGTGYQNHVAQMADSVKHLAELESRAQLAFLQRHYLKTGSWLKV